MMLSMPIQMLLHHGKKALFPRNNIWMIRLKYSLRYEMLKNTRYSLNHGLLHSHSLQHREQRCPTLRDSMEISTNMNILLIQKISSNFVRCAAGQQQKIWNKTNKLCTKQSKQKRYVIFVLCTCAWAFLMLIMRELKNIRIQLPKK